MNKHSNPVKIKLAFIGHKGVSKKWALRKAADNIERLSGRYSIILIVAIEDDVLGTEAVRAAKLLGIPTEVVTRTTPLNNLLPMDLTVGMTMWMASHFLLTLSVKAGEYSSIAREMCLRVPKKHSTLYER